MLELIVCLAAIAAAESEAPPARPGVGLDWAESFAAGRQASEAKKLPLLVDFKAEWCGPCKKLERETFGDEGVIRLLRQSFVAARVDVDAEPELAKKHAVSALPTVLILSPAGDELRRIVGFRPPGDFLAEIGKAAQASAAFSELKEKAVAAPGDAAAQRAYARALAATGNGAEASKVLRAALEKDAANPGLLLELGDLLRAGGKTAEARDAYEKLLALDPEKGGDDRRRALVPLARTYLELGEAAKGVAALDGYFSGQPAPAEEAAAKTDWLEARFLRGYAHAILKQTEKALADLRSARDADPQGPWGARASFIIDLVEPAKKP